MSQLIKVDFVELPQFVKNVVKTNDNVFYVESTESDLQIDGYTRVGLSERKIYFTQNAIKQQVKQNE